MTGEGFSQDFMAVENNHHVDIAQEEDDDHIEITTVHDGMTASDLILGVKALSSQFKSSCDEDQMILIKVIREGLAGFQWRLKNENYEALSSMVKHIFVDFAKMQNKFHHTSQAFVSNKADISAQRDLAVRFQMSGYECDNSDDHSTSESVPDQVLEFVPDQVLEFVPDPDSGPVPDPGSGPVPDPGSGPVPDPDSGPVPDPGSVTKRPVFSDVSLNQRVFYNLSGLISATDLLDSSDHAVELINSHCIQCTVVSVQQDSVVLFFDHFSTLISITADKFSDNVCLVPRDDGHYTNSELINMAEEGESLSDDYNLLKQLVQQTDEAPCMRSTGGDLTKDIASLIEK